MNLLQSISRTHLLWCEVDDVMAYRYRYGCYGLIVLYINVTTILYSFVIVQDGFNY